MNKVKRIIYENVIPGIGKAFVAKNKYCNIIYYHDIVADKGYSFMKTSIELFRQQMNYLADNGYETLRFDDFNDNKNVQFEKKRVLIAFDDGWKSNYEAIFSFMKELNIKYNIFLAIGKIGEDQDYLNWDIVRDMHKSGLVGFGVHTYSHPDMSNLDKIDKELEFGKANAIFKTQLGYDPEDFCYPFGYYSKESNEWITKNTGYQRIYLSDMCYSYLQNDKIVFGRNGVSNDEPMKVFMKKLDGCFNVMGSIL